MEVPKKREARRPRLLRKLCRLRAPPDAALILSSSYEKNLCEVSTRKKLALFYFCEGGAFDLEPSEGRFVLSETFLKGISSRKLRRGGIHKFFVELADAKLDRRAPAKRAESVRLDRHGFRKKLGGTGGSAGEKRTHCAQNF